MSLVVPGGGGGVIFGPTSISLYLLQQQKIPEVLFPAAPEETTEKLATEEPAAAESREKETEE
jgi:hypothetical protein